MSNVTYMRFLDAEKTVIYDGSFAISWGSMLAVYDPDGTLKEAYNVSFNEDGTRNLRKTRDATVLSLMRKRGLHEVATIDHAPLIKEAREKLNKVMGTLAPDDLTTKPTLKPIK